MWFGDKFKRKYAQIKRKCRSFQLGWELDCPGAVYNIEQFQCGEGKVELRGWLFVKGGRAENVCIEFVGEKSIYRYKAVYGKIRKDVQQVFEDNEALRSGIEFEAEGEPAEGRWEAYVTFYVNEKKYGFQARSVLGEKGNGAAWTLSQAEQSPFYLDAFCIDRKMINRVEENSRRDRKKLNVLLYMRENNRGVREMLRQLAASDYIHKIYIAADESAERPQETKIEYVESGQEKGIISAICAVARKRRDFLVVTDVIYFTARWENMLEKARIDNARRRPLTINPMFVRPECAENAQEKVKDFCAVYPEAKILRPCFLVCWKAAKRLHGFKTLSSENIQKALEEWEGVGRSRGYHNIEADNVVLGSMGRYNKGWLGQYLNCIEADRGSGDISLAFCHSVGGGAQEFIEEKRREEEQRGNRLFLITYMPVAQEYEVDFGEGGHGYIQTMESIKVLFQMFSFKAVYINELVSYQDVLHLLRSLEDWEACFGFALIFYFHDYYALCPRYNLMMFGREYCNLPEEDVCRRCAQEILEEIGEEAASINGWRKVWGDFLEKCREVIVFSECTVQIIRRVWNRRLSICLRPHKVTYMRKVREKSVGGTEVRIAVLGTLNRHKGLEVVKGVIECIEKKGFPATVVAVGECQELKAYKAVKYIGRYTREDLPAIMEREEVDAVWIPSIWPETFCYTAEEAMEMGMPVAVFNIGAPPERVRNYEKGLILESQEPEFILEEIFRFVRSLEQTGRRAELGEEEEICV